MKRLTLALLMMALTVPAAGQTTDTLDSDLIVQEYSSQIENEYMSLMVVHLNDFTTDALFSSPTKYSLRAQARMNIMFYLQGTANRDIAIDTDYDIVQFNDATQESFDLRTTAVNILNFEDGTRIAAGEQFQGIVSSPSRQQINLRGPFGIKQGEFMVLLRLSSDAVERLEQ